ncbi:16S rRNA (adenine(1518)-N(6)/adenine(1519)-N(6))-dimethyltransferase RsmA [Dehalobacterium formicoaceticum]|uniref:Ribosomal RNA small subunit methyltransferase A n=1 Tax=Dehalobacterium formicoaceticum TaxID=51515 RepID=A0ABT1Y2X6_9FIRM|nr:16S rRNA (adenine(1518)-N(6)/adenine(1519)-N(6))-dimethyltransferase RsmA [Dehalobacterium formicoaceticum]MCR6545227.1 16S rRNA (adenine(1518)-N(6)/adenine(1519)-N(6))-dimethyltransferase RsmA [Dehalobacterium formicoaceticum]
MDRIATPSMTREIINKYGLRMHKTLGQNFLIEPKFIEKIMEAAEIKDNQVVVEIGPGIGALTQGLAEKAAGVIALEIDRGLIDVLQDIFREKTNVHVVHGDALKVDFDLLVQEQMGKRAIPYKVVANLPYYITTPIIMRLLEGGFHFSSLVLMVQKEVARRMAALPGTKDYGALSIGVQYFCKPQLITTVPPTVFYPKPEVESTVIRLDKRERPAVVVTNEKIFFALVKAAFGQRRKTLLNALSNSGYPLNKEEWQHLLEMSRLDPKRRGETLSLEEFAVLANHLSDKGTV